MTPADAFVIEASITLPVACDPAAVGAAVTTELCGHWEHDGPCRWPHNNRIDVTTQPTTFRTLFVADPADAPIVATRIERALRADATWRILGVGPRPVAPDERSLAQRLLDGPRLTG